MHYGVIYYHLQVPKRVSGMIDCGRLSKHIYCVQAQPNRSGPSLQGRPDEQRQSSSLSCAMAVPWQKSLGFN